MRKGVWDLERLSKYANMIDTYVYQGKRYALYIDYTGTLILVSITDMWYIYIYEFIFDYDYIPDDLFYELGGILI